MQDNESTIYSINIIGHQIQNPSETHFLTFRIGLGSVASAGRWIVERYWCIFKVQGKDGILRQWWGMFQSVLRGVCIPYSKRPWRNDVEPLTVHVPSGAIHMGVLWIMLCCVTTQEKVDIISTSSCMCWHHRYANDCTKCRYHCEFHFFCAWRSGARLDIHSIHRNIQTHWSNSLKYHLYDYVPNLPLEFGSLLSNLSTA